MDEDIVAMLAIFLCFFVPIAGLTLRFALKPIVESIARLLEVRASAAPAAAAAELNERRIALLIDRERLYREDQRRTRLLRGARLKVAAASIEDINYKAARGLDKRQIASLATGEWIRRAQNLLITGAPGHAS